MSTAQRQIKIYGVILLLSLKEITDQLATANGVRWYGRVSRTEDGLVLRRVI